MEVAVNGLEIALKAVIVFSHFLKCSDISILKIVICPANSHVRFSNA